MDVSLLIAYLRNVSFTDNITNFEFQFDSAQDGPVWYDVVRYDAKTRCWSDIGQYTATDGLSKNKVLLCTCMILVQAFKSSIMQYFS